MCLRGWPHPCLGAGEPGPSRGAFPFSAAENLLDDAIGGGDGAKGEKQAEWEDMGDGGSAPSPFIAGEGQPAPPRSQVMMVFPCMSQGLVKSGSCRGGMGKRRRPRPINHHASTEATGYWGPRRSALDLWLRLEAKPEHALGPGATVGVLGTGVPRLACLRPMAWLCAWARMAHLDQQGIQDPHEGPSLARR